MRNSTTTKSIKSNKRLLQKLSLTIFAIFIYSASFSQAFMIGPRAGVSSSKLQVEDNVNEVKEGDASFGFHAGLFTRFSSSTLYVQPEVLFTSNRGKIEFKDAAGDQIVNEYTFNKIDVPVMVGLKFLDVFRVQAGPVASLLLKADAKEGGVESDVKENYKNATLGYQAGIGFDISNIIIDFKYEGNLSKFGDKVGFDGATLDTDIRNNQWLLSIGLTL